MTAGREPVQLPDEMSRETLDALLNLWQAASVVAPPHCEEYAALLRATALAGLDDVAPLTDGTPVTGRHWSSALMSRVAAVLDCVAADTARADGER